MLPGVSLANSENFANLTLPSPSQIRVSNATQVLNGIRCATNRKGRAARGPHEGTGLGNRSVLGCGVSKTPAGAIAHESSAPDGI